MFNQHPEIPFPPNQTTTIWRFIDFTRFVDFLDSSTLHFSRLDSLDDAFEGHGTAMDFVKTWLPEQLFRAAGEPAAGSKLDRWRVEMTHQHEQGQALAVVGRIAVRETSWVNCWHVSINENVALWRSYAGANKVIALKSSVAALRDSISPGSPFDVSIALVNYTATDEGWAEQTAAQRAVAKSKYFENEHELRAVVVPSAGQENGPGKGIKIPIDVNTLVESVLISPAAEDWIADLAGRVMAHYQVKAPVHRSTLRAQPDFVPPSD